MGLLGAIGRGFNSYLDRGVNASLAGVPSGLLNLDQTGVGPTAPGADPMMTPQQRHSLRMNYLMHLGQGISQMQPAAHLDDFRNEQIKSAMTNYELNQQKQMQAAAAGIFGGGQPAAPTPDAGGGPAPPAPVMTGASAAPGVAAPMSGGGGAAPVVAPTASKPGDAYRKYAVLMSVHGQADAAKKYTEIADALDKDPAKESQGAPVFVSKNGKSMLHQPTKEGPGIDTEMDPSLKDLAQTKLYGSEGGKNAAEQQRYEFENIARAAANPDMNQASWTALRNGASSTVQAQLPAMFSPTAQAAAGKMGVSPDKAAELAAAGSKPGDEWASFSSAYAKKLGTNNFKDLTADQQMAALPMYAQQKADPDVKASLLASRGLSDAMRQMMLNQMPKPEDAKTVAEDLIAHRMAPDQMSALIGGMGNNGSAFKRMVVMAAKQLQPDFNFEDASSQYQLVKSPKFQTNIRLMDGLQNSLGRLSDNAAKLSNGKVRSLNQVKNFAAGQLNGVDLKSFNTDRLLVADDVAQLLGGGGTGSATSDAKINNSLEIWKNSDDPAAIAAASKEVKYLIGIRKSALTKGTFLDKGDSPDASPGSGSHVNDWKKTLFGK